MAVLGKNGTELQRWERILSDGGYTQHSLVSVRSNGKLLVKSCIYPTGTQRPPAGWKVLGRYTTIENAKRYLTRKLYSLLTTGEQHVKST